MNEFSFERTPWELTLDTLHPGDRLSAVRFLALLEDEPEEAVTDALEQLLEKQITLDITQLPRYAGSGEIGQRLAWEETLVQQGGLPGSLPEDDPLRLYLEELAGTPACGDMQLLAQRFADGDQDAGEQLVNVTLSRVVAAAQALVGRGVLLLDLIQEGSLGLWQGILAWQGDGDFAGYIDWWIQQAMARLLVQQARSGGIGERMRTLLEAYRAADKRLLAQLGRNPSLEEIALELQLSPQDTYVVEQHLAAARTLAKARPESQPEQPEEEAQQAVEDTAYFQMRQRIVELLSVLEPLDSHVLTLRFGLEGEPPLTPAQTAQKLGLTEQDVLQREAAALQKLRG